MSTMVDSSIYQAVIDNAIDVIFISRPNGTILQANKAACELFGYTEKEFRQIGRQGIIDHSSFNSTELTEERQRMGRVKTELIGIHKNGERFPIEFSSILISSDENKALASFMIRDISERKSLETVLFENEQRFRSLVEHSTDIIMQVDAGFEIKYASPAVKYVMGMEVNEIVGKRLRDIISEEDRERTKEFEEIMSKPGVPVKKQYRVYHKNGELIWMEGIITNLLHVQGVHSLIINQRDISIQKQKEQELLRSNERFFYAAKATNDAIWDWDYESNRVIRTGDGLHKAFGYDPALADMETDFWTKRVHPDDLQRVLTKRSYILEHTGELYWDDEYRILKSDGTYAHIYDRAYIIRNEDGRPVRLIGATQNITPRREAEALLVELNNRLKKRAEELVTSNIELERFAYVASHDMQEPLRMVISFLQLLKKKYHGHIDDKADQYIHYAVDGAERMRKLILDLLEYSRVGSGKGNEEQVDVHALLNELLEVLHKTIQETGADIVIHPLPEIRANKMQMFQLFQNLLGNALKYHGTGSVKIEISCKEEEDHYVFGVADNGIGIDPVFFDKIFILFQRLHSKNEYHGTGIGLAVCKKIVEKHGGKIWVESEMGKGSCFYFSISKMIVQPG